MEVLRTKHGPNNGLFSNCSVRLHQIVRYFNRHKRLPDAISSQDQFHFFRDDPEMDVAKCLFVEDAESEIRYRHRIDYIHAKQFTNYKLLNFPDLLPLVKKYFTVSGPVAERTRELSAEYRFNFAETIGVIYRGNDKVTETSLPPYESFLEKAAELLAKNPAMRFFLQTDELEFREAFRARFPNTTFIKTLPPIPRNAGKSIVPRENRLGFAVEFVAAVQCLCQCRYLLIGSGNVDIWTVLFRGSADGVYQFLGGRFVDRDNVPLGRVLVKLRRYFGKIGWVYRWIGRRYFGFKPV